MSWLKFSRNKSFKSLRLNYYYQLNGILSILTKLCNKKLKVMDNFLILLFIKGIWSKDYSSQTLKLFNTIVK